ncbi:hypothetical protein CLOM_g19436, partial [Closterium sp. NIES-68]
LRPPLRPPPCPRSSLLPRWFGASAILPRHCPLPLAVVHPVVASSSRGDDVGDAPFPFAPSSAGRGWFPIAVGLVLRRVIGVVADLVTALRASRTGVAGCCPDAGDFATAAPVAAATGGGCPLAAPGVPSGGRAYGIAHGSVASLSRRSSAPASSATRFVASPFPACSVVASPSTPTPSVSACTSSAAASGTTSCRRLWRGSGAWPTSGLSALS